MPTAEGDEVLPAALGRLRRAVGLTQEQLADRSGLSVRAISSLECGTRRPRRSTVERLAIALGLSTNQRAALVSAAERAWTDSERQPNPAVLPATGPLIGRERELAELADHLAGGGPPVLAYEGEPGIGKSRLLAEAMAAGHAIGMPVLAAGTRRDGDGYAPLADALAEHVRRTPADILHRQLRDCVGLDLLLPELTSRVRGLPAAPGPSRRLAFEAACRYVDTLAGTGRLLLVLDDLHWAGPDAADLLAYLVRRTTPYVRVVVAYRAIDVPATGRLALCAAELARLGLVRNRRLTPLEPVAAATLVAALLGGSRLNSVRRRHILRSAGGLPLFLTELTRAALDSDDERVPWPLRVAIGQQLAALPGGLPGLMQRLAVAGTAVRARELATAGTSLDEVLDQVDLARRYGIVDDTRHGVRFRYPLIRETILLSLPPSQRRVRHPSATR
jgi:transcriptional regulator with XRE-family HTH domain